MLYSMKGEPNFSSAPTGDKYLTSGGYSNMSDKPEEGGGMFGGLASLLGLGGGGPSEEDQAAQEHQNTLQKLASMFMGGMGSTNPMTAQLMNMYNPAFGGMANGMSPYLLPASAVGGGLGSMIHGWMKSRNSQPAAQTTGV